MNNYSNEEKIKELYATLYKYLLVVLKDESLAQDFTQETLYKYLVSKAIFTDEISERAWILTVASNMCKNYWRSVWYKKVIPISDDFEIIQTITPENSYISSEENKHLMQEVMRLPSKYREVIHLFYIEDLSIEDISTILKRNKSTIQTQLQRARKVLKERLGNKYDF